MPDQKVMKVHYQTRGEITPGDIIQCPHCREKFVVLPGVELAPGVMCPKCGWLTSAEYYKGLARGPAAVELPLRPKKKGVSANGRPGKGVPQQRTRVKNGDQANKKKARSPRSKSA